MKVAMIGLGVIATKYVDAIQRSTDIDLIYACDLQETDLWIRLKNHTNCLKDYHLIPLDQIDLVFITTPPETHEMIASYFMKHHIKVFLEKPATKDLVSTKRLIDLAKSYQTPFDLIFHWLYGNEVLFLSENLHLIHDFDTCHIKVYDPYMSQTILANRLHLGGAWLDSGVNALSFLSLFIDLDQLKLKSIEKKIDKLSQQDYEHKRIYDYQGKTITIEIIWNEKTNLKLTYFNKNGQTTRS